MKKSQLYEKHGYNKTLFTFNIEPVRPLRSIVRQL